MKDYCKREKIQKGKGKKMERQTETWKDRMKITL
jgi:hypothetical protein